MTSLYNQQEGGKSMRDATGMVKFIDPLSGALLTAPHDTNYIKCPITGSLLRVYRDDSNVYGYSAEVIHVAEKQQLERSRKLYLHDDWDLIIQRLRNTTYVNDKTNERRMPNPDALRAMAAKNFM